MIAGLEEPTAGRIYFGAELVNFIPPHKRDVAMVFQSYALYPHRNVYDNVAFGLRMRRYPEAEIARRVKEAAEALGIGHLLDRRPNQLSGGQKQRVALGRAMVRQPAVFLMDEPLSNLDAGLRVSMRAELKELHRRMGTTFVYVTHDHAEALTLADQVVVMSEGLVQQIGSPDDIYERPRNTFVASFLGSPRINLFEGRLAAAEGGLWFEGESIRLPLPAIERIGAAAGAEVLLGVRPEDVREVEPGSEQAISGRVNFVMPGGADQTVSLRIGARDVFFRVGKESRCRSGEPAGFAVSPHRLHLFDRETKRSLLWG
jgi:multiple sugar transport system ATP-binding protein